MGVRHVPSGSSGKRPLGAGLRGGGKYCVVGRPWLAGSEPACEPRTRRVRHDLVGDASGGFISAGTEGLEPRFQMLLWLAPGGNVYVASEGDGRRAADKRFGYIHPCSTYPVTDLEVAVPRDV